MCMPREDKVGCRSRTFGIIRRMAQQNRKKGIGHSLGWLYGKGIISEAVIYPGNKYRIIIARQRHNGVGKQHYPVLLHRVRYKFLVPAFMITQHCIYPERRFHRRQRREEGIYRVVVSDIITTQEQGIGSNLLEPFYQFAESFGIEQAGVMQIGNKSDPEAVKRTWQPVTLNDILLDAPHPAPRQGRTIE